jgi:putative DNA primase/helicase
MRLSFSTRAVNMWLASPRTRKIDASLVVFDPTARVDQKTHVNLFRGLQMKPSQASCDKLLKLCRYLCGEDEETYTPVSDWVLDWCAYQVQHVGAKMRTAIVMHGPEGSGQEPVLVGHAGDLPPVLGADRPGRARGQVQRLAVGAALPPRQRGGDALGDEPPRRQAEGDVTEPYLHIRTAYMDARYEANHANLVFLSNEFQPLKISPGDRRYMVIRTPPIMDAEFYKDVGAELRAGGAAGFMRFLLESSSSSDFNEHTKPLSPTRSAT